MEYDDEKLIALQTYLEQKNSTVEKELLNAMDQIYAKNVPVAVREFIGMKAGVPPTPSVPKPRKKKSAAPAENAVPPSCSPDDAQMSD